MSALDLQAVGEVGRERARFCEWERPVARTVFAFILRSRSPRHLTHPSGLPQVSGARQIRATHKEVRCWKREYVRNCHQEKTQ